MTKSLEQKIESWSATEKEILDMPADKLRTEILNIMKYVWSHFGSPKQHYEFTNPHQDKINEKIDRFHMIRAALLENPKKAKELYGLTPAGADKKKAKDEAGFAKFYGEINDATLPYYGEPKAAPGGGTQGVFYPYTYLRDQVFWVMILFEKGNINLGEYVEEYSRKVGRQPEQKYTG
jgi:hypothetical protein